MAIQKEKAYQLRSTAASATAKRYTTYTYPQKHTSNSYFKVYTRRMTHVSSRKLPKKKWEQVYSSFIEIMGTQSGKTIWHSPLSELLTYSEKIMLAKRFAIIILSLKGMSSYRVCQVLDVAPPTVLRTRKLLDQGKYKHIKKLLKNKRKKKSFFDLVESILLIGGLVPPMAGEKRNDWIKRIDERRNI